MNVRSDMRAFLANSATVRVRRGSAANNERTTSEACPSGGIQVNGDGAPSSGWQAQFNPSHASAQSSLASSRDLRMSPNAALIVIDVQQTFDDYSYWGKRDNPDAEKTSSAWSNTGSNMSFHLSW